MDLGASTSAATEFSGYAGDDMQRDALPPSVVKILDGALRAISNRGARKLSMSDVVEASGVSRGTLYKYFSTKDDVLSAVSEFVSINFENGIRDAANAHANPVERFRAVMHFYVAYTHERAPDRIFEFEPAFYLDFFRTHFERHKTAVADALALTFDHIDRVGGMRINRAATAEALVRMQLSEMVVPSDEPWTAFWTDAADLIEAWLIRLATNTKKEI